MKTAPICPSTPVSHFVLYNVDVLCELCTYKPTCILKYACNTYLGNMFASNFKQVLKKIIIFHFSLQVFLLGNRLLPDPRHNTGQGWILFVLGLPYLGTGENRAGYKLC
jgi:hypothetical protein